LSWFAFILLCWGIWLFPDTLTGLLLFDRSSILQGQWWRLWTAHFTHFTLSQLIIDTAVIALLGNALKHRITNTFLAITILLSMPIISGLILWLVPDIHQYRGASSVGSMIWVLTACLFMQKTTVFSCQFWLSITLLFFITMKILTDILSISPAISHLPEGIHVAWQAHMFGAILGLFAWLVQFTLVNKTRY